MAMVYALSTVGLAGRFVLIGGILIKDLSNCWIQV
jgi:hypothetical protein